MDLVPRVFSMLVEYLEKEPGMCVHTFYAFE